MAEVRPGKQAVRLEGVVLAHALRLEALLNILERKGVIAKADVREALEEIMRLHAAKQKGRSHDFGSGGNLEGMVRQTVAWSGMRT